MSPYHPLGRQSRISCICGQTRPPPLPRIARLLQNHASVRSISLTFFKGWNSHNHVVCFWRLGLSKIPVFIIEINKNKWPKVKNIFNYVGKKSFTMSHKGRHLFFALHFFLQFNRSDRLRLTGTRLLNEAVGLLSKPLYVKLLPGS